jgi:hypothetical protein
MEQNKRDKIQKLLKEKQDKIYGVKGFGFGKKAIDNVDMTRRSVDFVGNTYYYVDRDMDVLVKGAATKTIADNGPDSGADVMIKHQADHYLDTSHMVGKLTALKEEEYEQGKYGITATSLIPDHAKGNENLTNYQMRMYDQHSIGFIYRDLSIADKTSKMENERENWNEIYPQLLNPEKADELGFFFVVKEIELWEISVVAYGANQLTPYLGSKGANKDTAMNGLFSRLDILKGQYGQETKSGKKNIELQIRQIKQMMNEVVNWKPSAKDILFEPSDPDTITAAQLSDAINKFKLF